MVNLVWSKEKNTNLKELTEYENAHLSLKYVHVYNLYSICVGK